MNNTEIALRAIPSPAHTVTQLVAIGLRWRTRMAIVFATVLSLALLVAYFLFGYASEMKILVQRDRIDPLVGAEQSPAALMREEITEEELNSEVQLLGSADVLDDVVLHSGLLERTKEPLWYRLSPN